MKKSTEDSFITNFFREIKRLMLRSMFMSGEVLTIYLSPSLSHNTRVVEMKDMSQMQVEHLSEKVLSFQKRKVVTLIFKHRLKSIRKRNLKVQLKT